MAVVFSKLGGANDILYGKFDKPIRAAILAEAQTQEKNQQVLKSLFNIEKSTRFAETVVDDGGLDNFRYKGEGQRAANLDAKRGFEKAIEHVSFSGTFSLTKEMADDSKFGIAANLKSLPQKFVRSYYRTRNKVAFSALINGTATSATIEGAEIDLSCNDGKALFHKAHPYKTKSGSQANRFYSATAISSGNVEKLMKILASKMRNFKDENGETLDYVADTIIIPSNRPELEMLIQKVCGSQGEVGTAFKAINTQYGNWNYFLLPGWETSADKFMIMSSAANKDFMGNVLYNRVDLDIMNEVDINTRNLIYNGYCRFGVGFNNWKHIAMFETANSSSDAESITLT